MSLVGKLAFITGGGSGIGRATSQLLAQKGVRVVVADKVSKNLNETLDLIRNTNNSQHLGLSIDVSNSTSIKEALKNVLNVYKEPPTIIVNSAGITRDNFLLKLSESDFEEVLNVNLKGTFLVTQTFAQALVEKQIKNASIINISSAVVKIANIGQVNYNASKAGVELLTKTAAKELGQFGIRCNAVVPGLIKTPMHDVVPSKIKEKLLAMVGLKRTGNANEVAEVIAFLASDESSYVNGALIDVTGGI